MHQSARHDGPATGMDTGAPGGVGYLGRLPQPDGRGTFLYLAGIHAIGAGGIVHYLHQEMAGLYREVCTRRFSTLIACRFDPHSREVLSSEWLTPLYRPGA